ncbi:DUF6482 family protein [Marinobacter halophilus]|uniref:Cation transporter n=1 Tax=Marinobacter halophilus TaxID=1323740 RepID=A0A2T1KKF6_9GAMM|nr:DUF6482 family protein [Marinobacter halophilus]PSF10102.1 hypothetical protein C7H08_00950 [Marinobacter halophilus]GGC67804.1 hypothetical protein GCM10011362_15320 [Marinobacter halophilus]
MRITLKELKVHQQPVIELLEIISLEGQHYMARLHGPEGLKLLSDNAGKTLLFRSAWEVQDTLSEFDVRETQIVHPSAYHEMVGMAPSDIEPMRIRVQRQRS